MSVDQTAQLANLEAAVRRIQSSQPTMMASSTATSSGLPTLLSAKKSVFNTTGTAGWTTYNASAVIPAGATWAWCELDYSITMPDSGTVDAYVRGRSENGGLELMLAHGRSSGGSDANSDCNQVMVPLNVNRCFDYKIDLGFDGGCELRIIGYFK